MLLRQFLRQPVFLGCTALLLILAISFACIGMAGVGGLLRQYDALEANYTTIAVPVGYPCIVGGDWEKEPDLDGREDGSTVNIKTGERRVSAARAGRAVASETARLYSLGRDERRLLSVSIPGTRALTSAELTGFSDSFNADSSRLVVLEARCTWAYVKPIQETRGEMWRTYEAHFTVEAVICGDERLEIRPGMTFYYLEDSMPHTTDGEIPFVKGERYLLRGFWSPPEEKGILSPDVATLRPVPQSAYAAMTRYAGEYVAEPDGRVKGATHGFDCPNYSFEIRMAADGSFYCCPKEDQWPFFAALGTQSANEFLAEHPVWREEILPNCALNHAGAALLLTDNADAIYPINTGRVKLAQGRMITPDEYAAGTPVCLVSAEYAALNRIAPGDVLHAEVYDSGYAASTYSVGEDERSATTVDSLTLYAMQPRTYLTAIDYTVVGIYTGATVPLDHYGLRPDSIIAPKASVTGAGPWYVRHAETNLLTTLILRNGSIDAFEAALEARLAGGYYRYYDGGYSAVISSMAGLRVSALWLFVAGVGAFLLAAALVGWLIRRRMLTPVRTMRLLGVSRRRVRCSSLGVMLVICLIALPLGTICGGLLYNAVAGAVLSDAIALVPSDLLGCSAVLGALLLLGCILLALQLANLSLMRSGRKTKTSRKAQPKSTKSEAAAVSGAAKPVRHERATAAAISIAPDAREKPVSAAMTGLFFRVLSRRVMVSSLLILLAGFGVFAALFLQQSIIRQQQALDDAIDNIAVECTVTAGDGASLDGIDLPYPYIFTLKGIGDGWAVEQFWGERAAPLAEVGEHVQGLRSMLGVNDVKNNRKLRQIHSVASDSMLDPQNGARVVFYDGCDDRDFAEIGGAVCLITDSIPTEVGEDGRELVLLKHGPTTDRLQVIGRVEGIEEAIIWLPLFYGSIDHSRVAFPVNLRNCAFTLADNRRLDEAKAALYALFFDASVPRTPEAKADGLTHGILIDDRELVTVQREMTATLNLLRTLTPILVALYAAIGFFGSYLPVRGRMREFAVMRSLGRTRAKVFASVFGETLFLTLIGAGVGIVAAVCTGEITSAGLIGALLVLCMFLCGAALAARQVSRVDLMQAMKGED